KRLRPGESVSYHRRFTAERDTLVATLPLGYSDGYPPQGVAQAEVLIRGR
ncbi:MAG: alanine racemase, partial [Gammaproteobacteria bacterium]|nr:alanine racemase [Gammaproteobacteria bacterium]